MPFDNLAAPRPVISSTHRKSVHDLRNLFAVISAAKHLLERDPRRPSARRCSMRWRKRPCAVASSRRICSLAVRDNAARSWSMFHIISLNFGR